MQYYDITTNEDTVPASSALTGTWTAAANSKRLLGASTTALSQIKIGQFIFDDANNEIRKVQDVQDNTNVILEKGFSNALSGATLKVVPMTSRQISVLAVGDVTIIDKYDNSTLLADKDAITPHKDTRGYVEPFIVDPAANTARILIVEN